VPLPPAPDATIISSGRGPHLGAFADLEACREWRYIEGNFGVFGVLSVPKVRARRRWIDMCVCVLVWCVVWCVDMWVCVCVECAQGEGAPSLD